MAELSKTAKQSMVREVKEVRVETPEESIRQLRLNLEAGLYVTPDRIKVLLSAYDQALVTIQPAVRATLTEAQQMIRELKDKLIESVDISTFESGKSYRVTRVHDEISIEPIEDAIIEQMIEPLCPGVVMAEIRAQEEDPHHLVDFGHHNTHPVAEGA